MTTHPTKGVFDASRAEWRAANGPDGEPGRIEVAFVDGLIGMRDAQDPDTVLVYTPAEWEAFIGGAKDGEFDLEAD
ncbi:MAG: DUF397 domain-containing protein [Micromonosporaceae bacterium]|nr:DUF397 domain-containing protein [Micromonosporaceae bacterium]